MFRVKDCHFGARLHLKRIWVGLLLLDNHRYVWPIRLSTVTWWQRWDMCQTVRMLIGLSSKFTDIMVGEFVSFGTWKTNMHWLLRDICKFFPSLIFDEKPEFPLNSLCFPCIFPAFKCVSFNTDVSHLCNSTVYIVFTIDFVLGSLTEIAGLYGYEGKFPHPTFVGKEKSKRPLFDNLKS